MYSPDRSWPKARNRGVRNLVPKPKAQPRSSTFEPGGRLSDRAALVHRATNQSCLAFGVAAPEVTWEKESDCFHHLVRDPLMIRLRERYLTEPDAQPVRLLENATGQDRNPFRASNSTQKGEAVFRWSQSIAAPRQALGEDPQYLTCRGAPQPGVQGSSAPRHIG